MKLFIGSDHAAFEEKEKLKAHYADRIEFIDSGPFTSERCDYPDYAAQVARSVAKEDGLGLLLCGSGIGVSMVANRFSNIRAALCRSPKEAQLSREHNNSNILCVGTRLNDLEEIYAIVDAWLAGEFQGGRHAKRVAMFNDWGKKS